MDWTTEFLGWPNMGVQKPKPKVGIRVEGDPKDVDAVVRDIDEAMAKHGLKPGEGETNATYGDKSVRRTYKEV